MVVKLVLHTHCENGEACGKKCVEEHHGRWEWKSYKI